MGPVKLKPAPLSRLWREGNRLSQSQVKEVIEGGGRFPGRERDEAEVRNHYQALEFVLKEASTREALAEKTIRTIHGLVMSGRERATKYRDGQNVIRDGRTGSIVYLPPEAVDRLADDSAGTQ